VVFVCVAVGMRVFFFFLLACACVCVCVCVCFVLFCFFAGVCSMVFCARRCKLTQKIHTAIERSSTKTFHNGVCVQRFFTVVGNMLLDFFLSFCSIFRESGFSYFHIVENQTWKPAV
jgi:hypothetical protein